MPIDLDVVPRILTRAEQRRPVTNAVVRDVIEAAARMTTQAERDDAFDRAWRAIQDDQELQRDEDAREIAMIRVMDALEFGRE